MTVSYCCVACSLAGAHTTISTLHCTQEEIQTRSEFMSKRLDLLFLRVPFVCLIKYFCAWLATWVGVLDTTKLRDMPRQSPFPNFPRPSRNSRCSSSVQGTPENQIQERYAKKNKKAAYNRRITQDVTI